MHKKLLCLTFTACLIVFPAVVRSQDADEEQFPYAWSHDGQLLAVGSSQGFQLYRPGEPPLVFPSEERIVSLALNEDASLVASSENNRLVHIWDTHSGDIIASWGEEGMGHANDLYFLPEQDVLAINFYSAYELFYGDAPLTTGFYLWHFHTEQVSHVVSYRVIHDLENMSLNSDRTLIAATYRQSQQGSGLPIAIMNVETGEMIGEFYEITRPYLYFQFSPTDPNRLASVSGNGIVRLWEVHNMPQSLPLTTLYNVVSTAAFSPDGTHLATGGTDGKVRVWEIETGALLEVYPDQPADIAHLRFASDTDLLAFGNPNTHALVWNAKTLEIIAAYDVEID
jgi:WD40 repeat protein